MKLVRESISDVLKPKDQSLIDAEVDPLIKELVDSISVKEFEEWFLYGSGISKKFMLPNNSYVITSSEHEVKNAVDYFTTMSANEEIINLWETVITNFDQNEAERIWDKFIDAFAEKFHLEW